MSIQAITNQKWHKQWGIRYESNEKGKRTDLLIADLRVR